MKGIYDKMNKMMQFVKQKNDAKQFKNVISAIQNQLKKMDGVGKKITLLKFTRMAIISELSLTSINELLYHGKPSGWIDTRFPFCLYGKNNEKLFESLDEEYECDLSNHKVISQPWHMRRFFNAFLTIAEEGFRYDKLNHMIVFYPQLDLYMAHNGLHSISAGVVSQSGCIPCSEAYDLTKMFENVHTEDGITWLDAKGQRIGSIPDFRLALIFEISKLLRALGEEQQG